MAMASNTFTTPHHFDNWRIWHLVTRLEDLAVACRPGNSHVHARTQHKGEAPRRACLRYGFCRDTRERGDKNRRQPVARKSSNEGRNVPDPIHHPEEYNEILYRKTSGPFRRHGYQCILWKSESPIVGTCGQRTRVDRGARNAAR